MGQTFSYVIILMALFNLIYGLLHKAFKNLIPGFDVFPSEEELKNNNYIFGGMYAPDFKKSASFKLKVLVIFNYCFSLVLSIIATNYLINLIY